MQGDDDDTGAHALLGQARVDVFAVELCDAPEALPIGHAELSGFHLIPLPLTSAALSLGGSRATPPAGAAPPPSAAEALAAARGTARQRSSGSGSSGCCGPLEAALVPAAGGGAQLAAIRVLRAAAPTMFIICCHPDATEDLALRISAFAAGANMATASAAAAARALARVGRTQLGGALACGWCGLAGLTPRGYWEHQPLHHIYAENLEGSCPVCGRVTSNLARHLHEGHPPAGREAEARTGVFALAVVRRPRDGKFLVTQEFAGQGFWLPGGGVDPGESLTAAALRETAEEAGVAIELKGVLCCESHARGQWRRVIFYGEPLEDDAGGLGAAETSAAAAAVGGGNGYVGVGVAAAGAGGCDGAGAAAADAFELAAAAERPSSSICVMSGSLPAPRDSPKSVPDFESAGACWASLEQLEGGRVPLRSVSELAWFWEVARGLALAPLAMPAEWAEAFQDVPF